MSPKVKLSEVIESMEFQPDEAESYLDTATGEIFMISDEEMHIAEESTSPEEYPEWQQEIIKAAKEILEDKEGRFITRPSRFDIDEYRMMEKFSLSVNDDEISDSLYAAIKGRGAFRRFKDGVCRFGLEKDWNRYRDENYKKLAVEWCKENDIEYIDDL